MNRLRGALGLTLIVGAALTACSPTPMNNDAGPDSTTNPDVTTPETGGPDVRDVTSSGDAGACRMIPVEDLSALGQVNGNTLTYSGDNRMATDSTTAGLQPPAGQTVCNFRSTRQRIFSYTTRTNSALRITTTNMGTDRSFDTTLAVAVATSCTATTRVGFCNDDDPQHQGDDRRVSSLVTTTVQRAGTRVFIALGGFVGINGERNAEGEQGNFELTVTELAPAATGAPCDVAGFDTVCADTATCVGSSILADMGTCRANGSAAGAACDESDACASGLTCDTTLDVPHCFETVADGMPCQRFSDAWQRCGADSSCVNLQRGTVTGVCRANGSVAGATCATGGTCTGAGLACEGAAAGNPGICLETVAAGGMCRTWDTTCGTTQDCRAQAPGGTPGTCTDVGTYGGGPCSGTSCTAPLQCVTPTGATAAVCVNNVMSGQPCGIGDQCPSGDTCYLTDPGDRYRGICRATGALGGDCRTTGAPCDAGLMCSDATTPANGRCLTPVAVGGACRIFGTELCATGSSCVRTGSSGLMGTCVADGTAPGAVCRDGATRCDGGAVCSAMTGAGICQTPTTAACDPRFGTNRCPANQSCRASGLETGTCGMPTMEAEPNDAIGMTQTVTLPAQVRGALSRFDLDCYSFAVPANGRIFARVNSPAGFCYGGDTIDLGLDLYDASGRLLGGDNNSGSFGCPRIDGFDAGSMNFPYAQNLPAGNYSVCVRNTATGSAAVTGGYVVDIHAQ